MNKLQATELFTMMKVYYPRDYSYMDEETIKYTIKVLYDVFKSYDPKTLKEAFEELAKNQPDRAPTIPQLQNKVEEVEKELMFKLLNEEYQDGGYIYNFENNTCEPNMDYLSLKKQIEDGIHLPEFKKQLNEKRLDCKSN